MIKSPISIGPAASQAPGTSGQQPPKERVCGLDSLRFVCALWVVFSHFGFVPLGGLLAGSSPAIVLLRGGYNNLFCGVAAVIIFFVISGFCIHFPYRRAAAVPAAAFLARRYLRIGIPCLIVWVVILRWKSNKAVEFYNAVMWSLVAECIYYSVYPLLFHLLRKWGWRLVVAANLVAFMVIATRPHAMNYFEYGPWRTWVVGLPCWLLGCMLAGEYSMAKPAPAPRLIWSWRALIWLLASLCSMLRFHGGIGFPWTLNFFAIACFFWLRLELRWFAHHPPSRALEFAGSWSYSLYLCHVPAFVFAIQYLGLEWLGLQVNWLVQLITCLGLSYLFYLTVEHTAHQLGRYAGKKLQAQAVG